MTYDALLWFRVGRLRLRRIRVRKAYRRKRRPVSRQSKLQYAKYEGEARARIEERLTYFNAHYRFTWKKVTVRNQRTRWGSCSKAGTLSFNFRLALLAPELLDYVVVHELCHLAEFNHSRAFWARVAETVPDWRARRTSLKKIRL